MYTLTPQIDPLIKDLLSNTELLTSLVGGGGSPLNIVLPQKMADNIQTFKQTLQKHQLQGQLFYAHKANKSQALVKQAYFEKIGVDVASEQELLDALAAGFRGKQIEVTGPKNQRFLLLAIQQSCLIQVDNISELKDIVRLHQKLELEEPVRILIRFCGFKASGTKIAARDSRFGIPLSSADEVRKFLLAHQMMLKLEGFSFHLDANTTKEKAIAAENLIELEESFQQSGLETQTFNLGGGYKINYLASEKDWNQFLGVLQQAALGDISAVTWNNSNYGLRVENGAVRGNPNFYEYYNSAAGAGYLDQILSSKLSGHDDLKVGQYFSEAMKNVIIEPGRSLLDQVGITVAQVNFIKHSANGEILVGLDMNRSNLASTDQEMMLDPVVISHRKQDASIKKEKVGVYFVGNLCLESDFIYKHKTFLDQLPEAGDLVVFINTAAYNMDFTESATIQQKIAKKIAVIKQKDQFYWFEDDKYNPFFWEENR